MHVALPTLPSSYHQLDTEYSSEAAWTTVITEHHICWPPTSALPVTCYAAVHWPELWLHCQSDYCGRGCSEKWQIVNILTQLSYWTSQKACSLISAIKILNLMHKHATLQITKELLQCFQALVYSQGISQNSSFLVSNFIVPKTIEERTLALVEVLNKMIMRSW